MAAIDPKWPISYSHRIKTSREEIIAHMSTNICRCGTYSRIIKAIERAAEEA